MLQSTSHQCHIPGGDPGPGVVQGDSDHVARAVTQHGPTLATHITQHNTT